MAELNFEEHLAESFGWQHRGHREVGVAHPISSLPLLMVDALRPCSPRKRRSIE
jgi:hypothetical protein